MLTGYKCRLGELRTFTFVPYLFPSITKIFLLFVGLRVSQFNGEKLGTSDPTQKTITNFITSGDSNRNCNSFPGVTNHDFVSDTETDLSIDSRQTCHHDCRDPFDDTHLLDVHYQSCTVRKNDGAEEVYLSLPLIFLNS